MTDTLKHHHHSTTGIFTFQCRDACGYPELSICEDPSCRHKDHEHRGLDHAFKPYPEEITE